MRTLNQRGGNQSAARETKLVEVRLSALTRVEYSEVVEVPVDITDGELNMLVNERYRDVDGGMFDGDSEYWERGTCYATEAEGDAEATVTVLRGGDGLMINVVGDETPEEPVAADVPGGG